MTTITLTFKAFEDEMPKEDTSLILYTKRWKDFDYGCVVKEFDDKIVVCIAGQTTPLTSRTAPTHWAYLPEVLDV